MQGLSTDPQIKRDRSGYRDQTIGIMSIQHKLWVSNTNYEYPTQKLQALGSFFRLFNLNNFLFSLDVYTSMI